MSSEETTKIIRKRADGTEMTVLNEIILPTVKEVIQAESRAITEMYEKFLGRPVEEAKDKGKFICKERSAQALGYIEKKLYYEKKLIGLIQTIPDIDEEGSCVGGIKFLVSYLADYNVS